MAQIGWLQKETSMIDKMPKPVARRRRSLDVFMGDPKEMFIVVSPASSHRQAQK
jgi:hypothetical protein